MIMTFSIVSQQLFALADVCWWDANLQQRVQREAFCACAGLKTAKIVFGLGSASDLTGEAHDSPQID